MTDITEFLTSWLELPSEIDPTEMVGYTDIEHFAASELVTTEQVTEHLRENVPITHLENCPSIEYDPDNSEFKNNPYTLAFFDRGSHEIKVGPTERFENLGELFETVTHEVGHNVHANIIDKRPEVAGRWHALHEQSKMTYWQNGTGFVSDYARTNVYEDFAESYKVYIHDPETLQFMSPEKYEFMQQEVFAGREYELKRPS